MNEQIKAEGVRDVVKWMEQQIKLNLADYPVAPIEGGLS